MNLEKQEQFIKEASQAATEILCADPNITIREDMRHSEMVKVLVKSGDLLKSEMTRDKLYMWLKACELQVSVGNFFDAIKKHVIYNKPIDKEILMTSADEVRIRLHESESSLNGCPAGSIIPEPTEHQYELLHMVSCMPGESQELLDGLLEHICNGQELNVHGEGGATEELGDGEFYIEGARARYGINRKDTLNNNYTKLGKRYEGMVYSDKAANERKDKLQG